MSRARRLHRMSTATLRAGVLVFGSVALRPLFWELVADIETELLARELPSIAEESGGWLVAEVRGMQ